MYKHTTRNVPRRKVCVKLGTLAAAAVFCCSSAIGQMQSQAGGAPSTSTSAQQNSTQSPAAQTQMQQGNDASSGLSSGMSDKLFLKKSMEDSLAEIQTAKLALTKSSNDQVKQFAQKMIEDHGKLLEAGKSVAQKNNVDVPTEPGKKDQAKYAKLEALSGKDFDKAYVKAMVKDHKADDTEFKNEAATAKNPDVRMMAAQGEPVIAAHLQMIEQLSKSMESGM